MCICYSSALPPNLLMRLGTARTSACVRRPMSSPRQTHTAARANSSARATGRTVTRQAARCCTWTARAPCRRAVLSASTRRPLRMYTAVPSRRPPHFPSLIPKLAPRRRQPIPPPTQHWPHCIAHSIAHTSSPTHNRLAGQFHYRLGAALDCNWPRSRDGGRPLARHPGADCGQGITVLRAGI